MRQWTLLLLFLASLMSRARAEYCTELFTGQPIEDPMDNDYCDCGSSGDKVATSACSGSRYWTGVTHGAAGGTSYFVCPQQPDVRLPLSKINDGVCDCCDGADESDFVECQDDCDAILEQQRAAQQALVDNYAKGSAIRQEQIVAFEAFLKQAALDLELAEQELVTRQHVEANMSQKVQDGKIAYWEQRHEKVLEVAKSQIWLGALTEHELIDWIIHLCQAAGERADAVDAKTCVPLRLAGADVGLLLDSESPQRGEPTLLADLLDFNVHNSRKAWKREHLNNKGSGRRLMEEEDDTYDEYDDHEFHDEYGHYHDDAVYDDYDTAEDDPAPPVDTMTDEDDSASTRRQEVLVEIRQRSFVKPQLKYLERAGVLLQKVDELVKERNEQDDDKVDSDVEDNRTTRFDDTQDEPSFDPVALPMVSSELENRKKRIERGFDYSVSAKVLLDAWSTLQYDSEDNRRLDLMALASQTMFLSELSLADIWKAYVHAVQDLASLIPAEDDVTCLSPWAGLCPPRTVSRTGGSENISLPPPLLLDAASAYCDGLDVSSIEHSCVAPETVPSEVADGYFGYYEVSDRSDDEQRLELYQPLKFDDNDPARSELEELKQQLKKAGQDVKAAENRKKDVEKSMGGSEGMEKFGPEGELHSIRDKCFSVEEGKYEYEICIYAEAKQKDKGVKHGGTGLGRWTVPSFDDESGRRVWKWENGVKCWNGPMRSVTAYVTCGAETRVLSADEPDTCRYVLEVESPVGCDESYRVSHNL